jgi:methylenetetrahydrofolate dehydrogenase (NAD+)
VEKKQLAMADTGPEPAPAPAPKGILLKADTVAEPFLAEVKTSLANSIGTSRSRPPKLVGILATAANAPSRSYAEFTRKQCVALGIEFELREVGAALGGRENGADGSSVDGTGDGDGVEEAIIEANADDAIDGIMVRALSYTFSHHVCPRSVVYSPRCIIQYLERSR